MKVRLLLSFLCSMVSCRALYLGICDTLLISVVVNLHLYLRLLCVEMCYWLSKCVSGPVYTTTNTPRIAIYPGKFRFIPVQISPDSGLLHFRNAKNNQTPVMFFTTGNLSRLPCLHECKYGVYQNLFSYIMNLPG